MDCNCCWERVVLKQWMGVETSYGKFLCQYMLYFNQGFGIAVLGQNKDKIADRTAEQSLPCAVLPGLEKLDFVHTRDFLSVMLPNLN